MVVGCSRFECTGRTAQRITCFEFSLDEGLGSHNGFDNILVMMKCEVGERIFENTVF